MIAKLSWRAAAPALFLAVAAAHAAAQSAAPLVPFSPLQAERAGVALAPVADAARAAASGGLRIAGTALLPNDAVEMASAPLAGTVQAVRVSRLQRVARGEVLARLHSPQLLEWQRDFAQSSAQASLAAKKLARDEALFREGIVSESRVQEARSAHAQAAVAARERRQALRLAGLSEAALGQLAAGGALSAVLAVTAPADGVVLELLASPGQRLDAGAPVARIGRTARLVLELQASREQSAAVRVGDRVTVEGCPQPGRIAALGPQVDTASQTVPMRAELPGAQACLRANQYIEATVEARAVPPGTLLVPSRALVRQGGRDYVFVREHGGFRPVPVARESGTGERIAVRGALAPGAEVAVAGLAALKGAWLGMGAR